MQGRDLNKKVKKKCVQFHLSLRIAPAFYVTKVDLCGPFKAYSPHNKRTTIKIWLAVYCCMSTSTTLIKVMED